MLTESPVVDCGPLSSPDNGAVDLSNGTTFGSIAVYSCNEEFVRLGSDIRICQADENWSGDPPTCGKWILSDNKPKLAFVMFAHSAIDPVWSVHSLRVSFLCYMAGVWSFMGIATILPY